MKITFKQFALAIALIVALLIPGLTLAQQNSLIQTSLSAAVPATAGTQFSSSQTFIQVASATGITGIQLNPTTTINQQNQWIAYVDREAMAIVGVNGTTLTVQRGVSGTAAAPHATATMVLFGRASWFYANDPGAASSSGAGISNVACTAANVLVTPYLNIRTGGQWICSTVTGTWVPGWNNPAADLASATATVASATGTVTPSGLLFSMTGTGAISGFTAPLGFNMTATGGGCFVAIPSSGVWTWTAAGNIQTAGTVTTANSVPVTFCWNALTSKWIPSRLT